MVTALHFSKPRAEAAHTIACKRGRLAHLWLLRASAAARSSAERASSLGSTAPVLMTTLSPRSAAKSRSVNSACGNLITSGVTGNELGCSVPVKWCGVVLHARPNACVEKVAGTDNHAQ